MHEGLSALETGRTARMNMPLKSRWNVMELQLDLDDTQEDTESSHGDSQTPQNDPENLQNI